jgi:hypothetical protein
LELLFVAFDGAVGADGFFSSHTILSIKSKSFNSKHALLQKGSFAP